MKHDYQLFAKRCQQRCGIQILVFFVLSLISFLVLWNQPVFTSDEPEIFIKGQQIARGQLLYQFVDSQHMPLMYHVAAVFSRLGISTLTGFRASFYTIFAFVLTLIYWHFRKTFGWKPIVIYLFTYLSLIVSVQYGSSIISEQLQGLGMVILFFEMLEYQKSRTVGAWDYIICSIAAFISFGSAFTSIFGIFSFYVAIFAMSIVNQDEINASSIAKCIKQCAILCVSMLIPFLIYGLYFVLTGTVKELYHWAYEFNRAVYPKYLSISQNYGNSILSALFGGLGNIIETFKIDTISTVSLTRVAVVTIFILFLLEWWKKDRVFCAAVLFFVSTCATRDGFQFHGIPVVAVFSAIVGYEVNLHMSDIQKWLKGHIGRSLLIVIGIAAISSGYLSEVSSVFSISQDKYFDTKSEAYALRILGEDYEEVGYFNVDHELLFRGKKLPANPTWGVCPWFWEWESNDTLAALSQKRPRIFCYRPNQTVWGYKVQNFAWQIPDFLQSGYTQLSNSGYSGLYVRDDYYYEAVDLLEHDRIYTTYKVAGNTGQVIQGDVIEQRFTAFQNTTINRIDLCLENYSRINTCSISVDITDLESRLVTELSTFTCNKTDNALWTRIDIIPYEIKDNHSYKITITSPDGTDGNAVALMYGDRAIVNEYNSIVRGVEKPNSLAMNIYSDTELLPALVVETDL